MRNILSLLALTLLSAQAASAGIEIRAGYSAITVEPEEINRASVTHPKLNGLNGLTADLVLSLAAMPVRLGARYEAISGKKEEGANQIDTAWNRVSVIVGRRLFDKSFFLGPLLTVAVSNDFKHALITNGTRVEYKTEDNLSASVGLETGFKFGWLMIGAELGYLYAPLGKLKTSQGATLNLPDNTPVQTDLSGSYVRGTLGFGF